MPIVDVEMVVSTDPVAPVFVKVLRAKVASGDELAREAQRVSEVVAAILGRLADNVHVLYEPDAAGRIAFGGELRRE